MATSSKGLQPSAAATFRGRRRIALRPLALQLAGLALEGASVAGLGYLAIAAAGLDRSALPGPALVACGYMAFILVQGGMAVPPHDAKTAGAMRALASAFIWVAMVAAE